MKTTKKDRENVRNCLPHAVIKEICDDIDDLEAENAELKQRMNEHPSHSWMRKYNEACADLSIVEKKLAVAEEALQAIESGTVYRDSEIGKTPKTRAREALAKITSMRSADEGSPQDEVRGHGEGKKNE